MNMLCSFYNSSAGKKVIMAVSGIVLVLFVIGHMVGNLKFFGSVDPSTGMHMLDHYAHALRTILADFMGQETFLWIVRAVMLTMVFLHALMAIQLSIRNKATKPIGYKKQHYSSATLASRFMFVGGLLLLFFIPYHILHFTTGTLHFQGFVEGHVFDNVVRGFSASYVVVIYILAVTSLSFHVYHGAWSMFQTLGWDTPQWNWILRNGAKAVAALLLVGFCSVPLAAHFGGYHPISSVAAANKN